MANNDRVDFPGVHVHESVCIDAPCEIGSGTHIWHFSHVMAGSTIGEDCNLGQNVVISSGVTLGNRVKIQNNVSVYSGVTLEDDVFCGPSMVFTNVINPRSEFPRRNSYTPTVVQRGATLGANSTIICGVLIGRYAFVGAGTVVLKDVPDYALVVGAPAKQIGWVCRCGSSLDKETLKFLCRNCGNLYEDQDGLLVPLREKSEGKK